MQKQPPKTLGLFDYPKNIKLFYYAIWWRRGESNPSPVILSAVITMGYDASKVAQWQLSGKVLPVTPA